MWGHGAACGTELGSQRCCGPQIFNAAVGAGADKDGINLNVCQFRAWGQPHVFQRACHGLLLTGIGKISRGGYHASDRCRILRAGAPCYLRGNVGGVQPDFMIVPGAGVGGQGAPERFGLLPRRTLGGQRAAFQIGKCCFIRRNQAGAGTRLDRHVADRHAAFHRQAADGRTGVFNHIACAACGTDFTDNGQDNVLGRYAKAQFPVHRNPHVFGRFLQQGLGGQHMLHLGGADPEGQCAKSAVGRGMAVAADNRHAGQGKALFGADHMHDALTNIVHGKIGHAKAAGVIGQRLDLKAGFRVADPLCAACGGHVVIRHGQSGQRLPHPPTCLAQAFKRLRTGDFMH